MQEASFGLTKDSLNMLSIALRVSMPTFNMTVVQFKSRPGKSPCMMNAYINNSQPGDKRVKSLGDLSLTYLSIKLYKLAMTFVYKQKASMQGE